MINSLHHRLAKGRILLGLAVLLSLVSARADWPMFRGNLQRQASYASFPAPPFRLKWRHELWRELTGPRAEVIVAGGLAFLGDYAGVLHAWDAATGAERWTFKTGGPIWHSPAWHKDVLYVGSLDGHCYALEARSGKSLWSYAAGEGLAVAPTVSCGTVLFGARDGTFYALEASTGHLVWKHGTAGRILTTAAVTPDGATVIFASEDMHVVALAVKDGTLRWKSRKLPGLTLRDYAPVLAGDLVFVTTSPVKDFHTILTQHQDMLVKCTRFNGKDPRYIDGTEEDVRQEQDFIVEFLKQHPEEQTFFAFRIRDGQEPWIAPILYGHL